MRELMPFTKGKKLYDFGSERLPDDDFIPDVDPDLLDETGSDLTPKPGIEGKQITGNLATSMIEESAGFKPEDNMKLILSAVQSSTPKEFIARYGQNTFNQATSMLEDAGIGSRVTDKTGNVTSFKLNTSSNQKAVKTVGGFKIPNISKFDLPPELQSKGSMSFGERLSEPTEKYIAGVTDKTTVIQPGGYDEIVRADAGLFDEGSQSRATASIRDDIKVLEDVIEGMSDEDFDRPITNKDMRVEESRRLARQNKARLRTGLEPKLPTTQLVNPGMDEFAGMSVGEYYTNQLAAKRASLEELKKDLGVGSDQVELMNRMDTASASMSVSDLEASTSRVETPQVTEGNPRTNLKAAEDVVQNKIVGGTSGLVGPKYARGGKNEGTNIFSYQSKKGKGLDAIVSSSFDAKTSMAKIDAYFNAANEKAKGKPSVALAKATKDLENIKDGWRQAGIAAGLKKGTAELEDYVAVKTYEDIAANVEKKDWMGTGLNKNAQYTSSPSISRIIEEAERTGQMSNIRGAIDGSTVDPTPEMQARQVADQIKTNVIGAKGLTPEQNAKALFPDSFPEAVAEIKASPEAKNAGEVIGTKQIHSAFTVDSAELVKNPDTGNYEIKQVRRSSPYSSALQDNTRQFDYGTQKYYDHSSQQHTVDIDTTGIEPEGYDPLTKNKVVPLPGENASQAAKRAAVLAKVSGWDFESGAWKANSDINAYAGRQRTLATLVDQGAINPNDIAWNAINDDIDAGTFDSSNIKKYLKLSGASDTAASALKTSVNIKTSGRVKSPVTIGSSQVPAVKPATQVAPAKPDTSRKLDINSITDAEIKTLPIYRMMREEFGNTESLKALSSDALDNYTVKQARNQLNILSKQEGAAGRGFAKMIETIIKSR